MDGNVRLTENVTRGGWGTVDFAVLANGSVPAKDFLDGLSASAKATFLEDFQKMADYGVVPRKRFKKEMGTLFAFRNVNLQVRFPCFRDGKSWILTHGFYKPGAQKGKGQWPRSQTERAEAIEAQYRTRK